MYKSPKMEVLGSLRELTLAGGNAGADLFGVNINAPGCTPGGPGVFICRTS